MSQLLTSHRKLAVLFACWLLSIGVAFWLFYFDDIKVFDPQAPYTIAEIQQKQTEILSILAGLAVDIESTEPLYIHFLSNHCHCYDYAKRYIAPLIEQQTRHLIMAKVDVLPQWQSQTETLLLSHKVFNQLAQSVPSTPALLIVRNRQLQYLGPHSAGFNCGDGNDFIDLYQNNLAQGFEQPLTNLKQMGCFCSNG